MLFPPYVYHVNKLSLSQFPHGRNATHAHWLSNDYSFRLSVPRGTVFRNSIERWADGLKTLEMVQGGNFGNEQGTWEAPR